MSEQEKEVRPSADTGETPVFIVAGRRVTPNGEDLGPAEEETEGEEEGGEGKPARGRRAAPKE